MKRIKNGEEDPSPLVVELVAVAERALNFMHTGNAAVLVRRLMDGLWLSHSLLVDGLPCFDKAKVYVSASGVDMRLVYAARFWPCMKQTKLPLSASQASVLFKYGEDIKNVSVCSFLDVMGCIFYMSTADMLSVHHVCDRSCVGFARAHSLQHALICMYRPHCLDYVLSGLHSNKPAFQPIYPSCVT